MKRKLFWILLGGGVVMIVAGFALNIGGLRYIVDGNDGKYINAATADGDDHDEKDEKHGEHGDERGAHGTEGENADPGADRDEHEGEEGATVSLTDAQVKVGRIESVETTVGKIDQAIQLTGEIHTNQDRVIEVVPRVPGIVRSVGSFLGDNVEAGTVMVVLDSRELADAKSTYFGSRERTRLALTKFKREESLWRKKISSEQEYLNTRSSLAEAQIAERGAAQKLRALGVSPDNLKDSPSGSLTRFEVVAPFGGTIIEKKVTVGASVDEREPIYRIADLRTVWVIANVYEKDIAQIVQGQTAAVRTGAYPDRAFMGRITWIADTLDERTRTLKVRVEVDNDRRLLKPGMFVTAKVTIGTRGNVLRVPDAAIRRQGGETIVFVDEGSGRFERREVILGIQSNGLVEIRKGLKPGERVVAAGSFILKSELEKEGFGGGHGH